MIYTATTASLAVLETLAHMSLDVFPENLVMVTIEVPEELVQSLDANRLPDEWTSYPASAEVKKLGDVWAKEEQSLGLLVPSVLLPQEKNLILNPLHPRSERMKIVEIIPYRFDRRLLKKQ